VVPGDGAKGPEPFVRQSRIARLAISRLPLSLSTLTPYVGSLFSPVLAGHGVNRPSLPPCDFSAGVWREVDGEDGCRVGQRSQSATNTKASVSADASANDAILQHGRELYASSPY
jgi:hypothetical protein